MGTWEGERARGKMNLLLVTSGVIWVEMPGGSQTPGSAAQGPSYLLFQAPGSATPFPAALLGVGVGGGSVRTAEKGRFPKGLLCQPRAPGLPAYQRAELGGAGLAPILHALMSSGLKGGKAIN